MNENYLSLPPMSIKIIKRSDEPGGFLAVNLLQSSLGRWKRRSSAWKKEHRSTRLRKEAAEE